VERDVDRGSYPSFRKLLRRALGRARIPAALGHTDARGSLPPRSARPAAQRRRLHGTALRPRGNRPAAGHRPGASARWCLRGGQDGPHAPPWQGTRGALRAGDPSDAPKIRGRALRLVARAARRRRDAHAGDRRAVTSYEPARLMACMGSRRHERQQCSEGNAVDRGATPPRVSALLGRLSHADAPW